jgi:Asp-tRNA(Asn)/Glu-tRNA(Gln) amidotransferase B subunit
MENPPKPFKKVLANWLLNTFQGMCKKRELHPSTCGISPEEFGQVIMLHYIGVFNKDETKSILEKRLDQISYDKRTIESRD